MEPRISVRSSTTGQSGPHRDLPHVCAIVPILNEGAGLARTLESLVAQNYPHDRFEILVVDGGSKDDSLEITQRFAQSDPRVRLLRNPRRNTPAAINLAVQTSDADAFLWLLGHCELSPDYTSKSVQAVLDNADTVAGGWMDVRGHGFRGRLNELLLASPFGTGLSSLRFDRKPGWTDSIAFALYRREYLLVSGGLDESLTRNQDIDMLNRLREHGIRFWRVDAPAIYSAPATFSGLWSRAWRNGAWIAWAALRGRAGSSWWHFAPMAMTALGSVLIVLTLLSTPFSLSILLFLSAAYVTLALYSAITRAARRRALWAIPMMPILFFLHHTVYGLGSWSALVRRNPIRASSPTQP